MRQIIFPGAQRIKCKASLIQKVSRKTLPSDYEKTHNISLTLTLITNWIMSLHGHGKHLYSICIRSSNISKFDMKFDELIFIVKKIKYFTLAHHLWVLWFKNIFGSKKSTQFFHNVWVISVAIAASPTFPQSLEIPS